MASPQKSINLEDLEIPQLQQVKTQLEEEISHLTGSFTQLRQAQASFADCLESLEALAPSAGGATAEGKSILVPLTSSLYVPGKLANAERVIVDLGTGYYADKPIGEARKLYAEKVAFVKGNLETLQATVTSKQNNLRVLLDVMQYKMSAANAAAAASVPSSATATS